MRLSTKLVLPTALLIALPVLAVIVTLKFKFDKVAENSLKELSVAARTVQDKIDRNLFERYGDVQAFGLNALFHRDLSSLSEAEEAELGAMLDNYVLTYGCYSLTVVTDLEGRIAAINTVGPLGGKIPSDKLRGRDLSRDDWYKALKAEKYSTYQGEGALTGTYIGKAQQSDLVAEVYGKDAPVWNMSFSAPIRNAAGETVGYWHNEFSSTTVEEIVVAEYNDLEHTGLETAELTLLDPSGLVLLDIDPSHNGYKETRRDSLFKTNLATSGLEVARVGVNRNAPADGSMWTHHNSKSDETASEHADEMQGAGYARSVPVLGFVGTGFTTLVRVNEEELTAMADSIETTMVVLALVSIVVGIAVMVFLVARPIVSRVSAAAKAIESLADGGLNNAVETESKDEIGDLGRSLKTACDGLKKTFESDNIDWGAMAELKVRASMMDESCIVSEADLKGTIISCNDKFTEVSQYSREELIGQGHNKTRHPDMPKSVFKELWATIGRGKTFRGVVKNMKKDGTPYYVDAVIAPVMGDNGKPRKYIGVRYDITEAEIERQASKGILDAINGAYAYIEFDTEGQILKANDNFLGVMGYESEEIVGKHHRMFVDSKTSQSVEYSNFWKGLKNGETYSDSFKRITKDGREVWIQAVYAPVKDEVGRVVKVVKIATDVTEAKIVATNNERQLEEANKNQAVIEFDANGIVQNANKNFLDCLGYTMAEIKGQHHSMFVEDEYARSADYTRFWADLNDGRFMTDEFKRIGKGGKEVWIQATYNPRFDASGKVGSVIKFATDITAKKAAEEGLAKTLALVAEHSQTLASASEELTATAQNMNNNTEDTARQAGVASSASEQVAANISMVATAAEEMSSSVQEIAKNAAEAAQVGSSAVTVASNTNDTVTKLGASSVEIGEVIKVITSIAEQTNLLALNATIEAARAGEAGKGFAVVANEVKELAKQTAAATEDISAKIEAIQHDASGAVSAIGEISEIIRRINDIQNEISSAVDEQSATTNEIARNVSEASRGSSEISENIVNVSSAARYTTEGANDTLTAAQGLARLSSELQGIVDASRN
ncbi:PAS domain-containing protein [Pelagicoccus albus]|uniref:PAS domain S-box protein n=1 Tax=Pelagicoccus albus TaxID=415222 RepID=A0A7X1B7U8_9BACT|nr:PAS domain-containing protein [Pelagicoccus albus]MBC2607171.1 PAS domain S-box protein [Pelagicoccus albus]